MSFLTRVASFAALSFCMLGLGNMTTASRAAELASVSIPSTLAKISPSLDGSAAPLPIPSLPTIADQATATTATRFTSLEDAVAAQGESEGEGEGQGMSRSDEVACLAGAIYFEANVILNRTRSGRFPTDVCGVVTQRGQFSFVRDGHVPVIDAAARGYRTAVALARVALAKAWDSPAPEALFFHARRVGMGRGTQVAAIGNHIFYR